MSSMVGAGAGMGTVDGMWLNARQSGISVVFGTRVEGWVGADADTGVVERTRFGIFGLTGPPVDCTIISLSFLPSSMLNTSFMTVRMSKLFDWKKSCPMFLGTSIWSSLDDPPKD